LDIKKGNPNYISTIEDDLSIVMDNIPEEFKSSYNYTLEIASFIGCYMNNQRCLLTIEPHGDHSFSVNSREIPYFKELMPFMDCGEVIEPKYSDIRYRLIGITDLMILNMNTIEYLKLKEATK
jgi:hypothetical protein